MDQNTSNEKHEISDQQLEDMLLHDLNNSSSTLAVDHQHSKGTASGTNNIDSHVNLSSIKQEAPTTKLLGNYNNDSSSSTTNAASFVQEENKQLIDEGYYDDIFFDFADLFPEGLDFDFDMVTNTNNDIVQNETKCNSVGYMANGFNNQINSRDYYYHHHSYMAPRVHFFKAVAPPALEPVNSWRICKGRRRKGRKPIESLLIFNKQQQKINNRISAAKSIAKKQAHVKYLEEEVVRLRSENEKEKKVLKFMERSLEIPLSKRSLARTISAPTIQFEG